MSLYKPFQFNTGRSAELQKILQRRREKQDHGDDPATNGLDLSNVQEEAESEGNENK